MGVRLAFATALLLGCVTFAYGAEFRVCGWQVDGAKVREIPDGVANAHPLAPASVRLRRVTPGVADPQFCGGVLIGEDWVLTARHCVDLKTWTELSVVAGTQVVGQPGRGYVRQATVALCPMVAKIGSLNADMALLHLDRPVPEEVARARIGRGEDFDGVTPGTRMRLAGWRPRGADRPRDPIAISPMIMDGYSPRGFLIGDRVMRHEYAPCGGESGGGLFLEQGSTPVLIGILSAILPNPVEDGMDAPLCTRPGTRALFTPLAEYAGWISATMAACAAEPGSCLRPE